ncbi:apolipoprotein N-acyltransferase [Novosphingobium aromaticivorans DSM 12444]|uniref:Apolipoprotein N-acyltransferase n=1 Tax=Novosphingobium aromaticivorans (strain ATCC 700278 / DSM 12444 / CCUG 56034 / CIP 105152 / NBRC 16084 / F199) TaxID=279238 RepID=Q2GBP0_NOVAD|nr:apolipoprotein N-acyltransferase [Novosphingobium aromaticivorans]ABD24733.1 apolipoprotein N-acyltransferase [Novosphingobium aromaticivorans DSM 12444]SCY19275.1 apolipoprotein N-acyltransferase [Novosphingobium aromaticivorans]
MVRLGPIPRPHLYTILAGALAACGFQPLGLWPFTLAALGFLVHRIDVTRTWRQALLAGWLFGVGHFTVGNGWIATAFTYQAEMPAWLGWIAVFLLALYLALYPALATLGGWWLARTRRAALLPAFAACWIVAEWLRSWIFTGFAWNPLAMVTLGGFERPGLALSAQWLGTYALSGLVVLLGGWWLFGLRAWGKGNRWGAAAYALGPAILMVLPLHGERREGTLPFTLVQPDVRQELLNDPANYENQFRDTAALSLHRAPGERRLVLWPESGVPDFLRPGYARFWYEETTYAADPALARERIGRVIGPGSLLFTGTTDLEQRRGRVVGAWNVVTALDSNGAIRGGYAKAHLVPYGEYLPMRTILEPLGLSRLVAGSIDFLSGPGPRTVDFGPHGKAGFQICYEIIFSGQVVDRANRPDYLFNPSNDGWFGSWGPPQHLAQARMRAIEEGLPVLRATTTGISAVIDADGVVRQFLPQHRAGRIDGKVPPAHAPTPFARTGNALALGWAAILLLIALVATRARKR